MYSFYLTGLKGEIFTRLYVPKITVKSNRWVVIFPAFSEEMNKCRAMVSSQARSLAEAGLMVVVPDLYGTGDSEGEYIDADWSIWRTDMQRLIEWVTGQGASSICFLGIRLGCLLAADVTAAMDRPPDEVVFWQPISDGKLAMTQFLRLRVAAEMMSGVKISVSDLRESLIREGKLEISGYELSQRLIQGIDRLRLEVLMNDACRFSWIEVVTHDDKPLPMVSRQKVQALVGTGYRIKTLTVTGDAFWSTQEITHVPELITKTTKILSDTEGRSTADITKEYSHSDKEGYGSERAIQFSCQGSTLVGILHEPSTVCRRGIVLVVGGPQYRVGSHRQFVVISRALAAQGFAVLRFDYRGMGDSEGVMRGFEHINDDIKSAIDTLCSKVPGVKEVILWGLCDAATAATFYAPGDPRIEGLVLINPWVRSEQVAAKVYLKHYYLARILSYGFWAKVWRGEFNAVGSVKSLWQMMEKAGSPKKDISLGSSLFNKLATPQKTLSDRVYHGLNDFSGRVLFILSGHDLTAEEFKESVNRSKSFKRLMDKKRFRTEEIDEADHTFSKRQWRDKVINHTLTWLSSW